MIPRHRPARVAAAVGATVAAGAVAMLTVTTAASADEPGRCLQNVNIREEPDTDSRIVALCEAGTRVQLGAERDGFVRIDELGGWASKDFVQADELRSPSSPSSDDDHEGSSRPDGGSEGDERERSSEGAGHSDESGGTGSGDTDSGEAEGAAPLGGLLG